MNYKDRDQMMKHAQLQAKRRAKLEAKARAFDSIKALLEGSDYDGVIAKIKQVIEEVK